MDASARLAFEETALPHLDSLYRVAVRLTGDCSEAEDLVQDTIVRAYRFWGTFKAGTNIRAWLFTILRNTFYSQARRANRLREQVGDLSVQLAALGDAGSAGAVASEIPTPERAVTAKLTADKVHAALERVPEDYRLAVMLADLEGLAYKEIAAIMECPIGTVMSRIYRGRRQLQQLLQEEAPGAPAEGAPLSLDAYRKRGHA